MFTSIKQYKPIHLERFLKMHEKRMRACGCSGCADFLTAIHSGGSLSLEHEAELRALKFWSIDWTGHLEEPQKFHAAPTSQDAILHCLVRDEKAIASLHDAEMLWQSGHASGCVDVDSDEYWLSRFKALKHPCLNESEIDVACNHPDAGPANKNSGSQTFGRLGRKLAATGLQSSGFGRTLFANGESSTTSRRRSISS